MCDDVLSDLEKIQASDPHPPSRDSSFSIDAGGRSPIDCQFNVSEP